MRSSHRRQPPRALDDNPFRHNLVQIQHAGQTYRRIETPNGKLVLKK